MSEVLKAKIAAIIKGAVPLEKPQTDAPRRIIKVKGNNNFVVGGDIHIGKPQPITSKKDVGEP